MPLLFRLFLYGTLMRGGANHAVIESRARFLGEGRTRAPRTLVDLGPYPALLPRHEACREHEASAHVSGEIWEVDDVLLAELDTFEGVPDLYTREPIELDHSGGLLEAFTYVFARRLPPRAREVTTGRYEIPTPLATPDKVERDE